MSWRDSPERKPWLATAPRVRWLEHTLSAGHVVTCCLFDLDDADANSPSWLACLSEDEFVRAQRFKFAVHAQRFRAARAMTRRMLSWWCQCPAEHLSWLAGAHGKPHLNLSGAPHFNLSHSGRWGLLAISATLPVGVDIELQGQREHVAKLSAHILHPDEIALARTASGLSLDHDPDHLLRTWVRKEACLKAWGTGLSLPMTSLDLGTAPEGACATTCGLGMAEGHGPGSVAWQDLVLPPECQALACLAWPA